MEGCRKTKKTTLIQLGVLIDVQADISLKIKERLIPCYYLLSRNFQECRFLDLRSIVNRKQLHSLTTVTDSHVQCVSVHSVWARVTSWKSIRESQIPVELTQQVGWPQFRPCYTFCSFRHYFRPNGLIVMMHYIKQLRFLEVQLSHFLRQILFGLVKYILISSQVISCSTAIVCRLSKKPLTTSAIIKSFPLSVFTFFFIRLNFRLSDRLWSITNSMLNNLEYALS